MNNKPKKKFTKPYNKKETLKKTNLSTYEVIYIQENFLLTINSLVVLLVENRTIAKPL